MEATKNRFIAFLLVLGVLSTFLVYPPAWAILWSVIASFLVFEVLMSNLAKGGKGFFIFSPVTNQGQYKGHAFIVLFLLVMFATGASAVIAEIAASIIVASIATNLGSAILAGVLLNFVACSGLYAYMNSRFYSRGSK